MRLPAVLLVATIALPSPSWTGDVVGSEVTPLLPTGTITGRASVIDGRTLWFPRAAQMVRLAGIDVCELPQWAFDPTRYGANKALKPVPCGPIAKAWLKRSIGSSTVACTAKAIDLDGKYVSACSTHGRDLAIEMLRVGWARVTSPSLPQYVTWQRYAMAARYGMWATYVLDMDEWRTKAVDRTLQRQPTAEFNLLAERKREISPPFADARKRPRRTDRCHPEKKPWDLPGPPSSLPSESEHCRSTFPTRPPANGAARFSYVHLHRIRPGMECQPATRQWND